jgi:hypothetical protein
VQIPVFYVFWQMGVTIVGGVMYEEFTEFLAWHWVLYLCGILVLFAGIKVAAKRCVPPPPPVPLPHIHTTTITTTLIHARAHTRRCQTCCC